jgi:hypothetical protein
MRYLYVPEMCCYLIPLSGFAFLKQHDPNAQSVANLDLSHVLPLQ